MHERNTVIKNTDRHRENHTDGHRQAPACAKAASAGRRPGKDHCPLDVRGGPCSSVFPRGGAA